MLGRGHQPGPWIVGNAGLGPALQGSKQRILRQIFGNADVADHAGESPDQLGGLDPPYSVDGAVGSGSSHVINQDGDNPRCKSTNIRCPNGARVPRRREPDSTLTQ